MKLFVYGSQKRGFRNDKLLKDQTFIGDATTVENYTMFPSPDFRVALALENFNKYQIHGELYVVNDAYWMRREVSKLALSFYVKEIDVMCNDKKHTAHIFFTKQNGRYEIKGGHTYTWTKDLEIVGFMESFTRNDIIDALEKTCPTVIKKEKEAIRKSIEKLEDKDGSNE